MHAAATLEVDLSALAANYRLLTSRHAKKNCAAVVKANAYGLGVEAVSKALEKAGCREFFVATLAEGIELRSILPEADIAVFNGMFAGEEKEYAAHRLTPIVNDLSQVERIGKLPAILHVDTGITRLGLCASDLKKLLTRPWQAVMSHLACANEPKDPKNAEQLARFREALKLFPGVKASLCNSSGIFLPADYHFDMARPGCALYGINPVHMKNPMRHVATLSAPILQLRTLDRDETVGYGATYPAAKGARIALTGLGYADGYFRSLSNQGFAHVEGVRVPIAGRVSMDMIALDVSALPEGKITPATRAEFINAAQDVNAIAEASGTIGYEIFTRIGRRVARVYHPL
jgi:alanine racemase